MSSKLLRDTTLAAFCALAAATSPSAQALAQASYPSGAAMRAGLGPHGAFDVNAGETYSFADLGQAETYRVCIVGRRGRLIVDGEKEVAMDNGDCHDGHGSSFQFRADEGQGETQVYYRHVRRHRR